MRLREQLLTRNACYTFGGRIKPTGVMVHSTGANNPRVSRYIPGTQEIGFNTSNNHWNQTNAEWKAKYGTVLNKCVHAFIGLFSDNEVGTVQTLPWTTLGWHCAGRGNNTHIGFEICEDGLADASYFSKVYNEAAEFTAYLCKLYNLDPLADGVVICHQEGSRRGVASNHADVLHWFPKFGKSMDNFRNDVAALMQEDDEMLSYEQWKAYMEQYRAELALKDVDSWAREEMQMAHNAGIIKKISDRPLDLVTRQEAAIMALRASQVKD